MRTGEAGEVLAKDSPELVKLLQIFNPSNKTSPTRDRPSPRSWLDELLEEEMYSHKKAGKSVPRYQRNWESKPQRPYGADKANSRRHRRSKALPSTTAFREPQRNFRSKHHKAPHDTVLARPRDLHTYKKSHADEYIQRPWPKQRTSDITGK